MNRFFNKVETKESSKNYYLFSVNSSSTKTTNRFTGNSTTQETSNLDPNQEVIGAIVVATVSLASKLISHYFEEKSKQKLLNNSNKDNFLKI